MNRREFIALLAAAKLPANQNVKWALSSALWNQFRPWKFTDMLDVMKDTGFTGMRLTSFPAILDKYSLTAAQMQKEFEKRNLHAVTISAAAPSTAQERLVVSARERRPSAIKKVQRAAETSRIAYRTASPGENSVGSPTIAQ